MKVFASFFVAFVLFASQPQKEISHQAKQQFYISYHEHILGTSLSLKFLSNSEQEAERAESAALTEIERLSDVFSAYDPNSEFSRWMTQPRHKPVKVSDELLEMLSLFDQWKGKTKGALDASAAVAGKLWADAAIKQQKPSKVEIEAAVSMMQQEHYQLNITQSTATRISAAPLMMNTFAKSYIINKACDAALAAAKVDAVVVNIGGDLVVKGNLRDEVLVTNPLANAENDTPLAHLLIENKAVATSGNYRRGEQIGKHWYSHIVDPRTGEPVEGVISATVIAPKATDAGALATAFNVLSIAESKALAETVAGAEYLIITKKGKKIESKGWKNLIDTEDEKGFRPKGLVMPMQQTGKPWDSKYELAITFEMNVIKGNSHRPFAAIWIEDANRQPVRNLALWYNKTKWIPDLRTWYRINGEKFKTAQQNYASVTGATRSPGKYTLKWDGKDDQGRLVPQGKYTIIIESAKEHGTNEIIRQTMELKKTATKASAAGNVEISNITFDFYKK